MSWRSRLTDVVVAVAVVAGGCIVIGAVESVGHVSKVSNVFIILIAVLASRRGMFAALVAAVLPFLAFDWLFVRPVRGFTVADPSEYMALATLLVTILVIGQLLAVARSHADESDSLQRQTQLLYDVSTAALPGPHMTDVYPMALWRLNEALGIVGSRRPECEHAGHLVRRDVARQREVGRHTGGCGRHGLRRRGPASHFL